jgi:hypothetical protein
LIIHTAVIECPDGRGKGCLQCSPGLAIQAFTT